MSQFLPEPIIRQTVERLWILASEHEAETYDSQHWIFAISDLAKQLKDPQLLEKAKRAECDGELSIAAVIDIAKLYFQCGELATAQTWIERVPLKEIYMADERDDLRIAIYRKQNDSTKLAETAWRAFRRDRSVDSLNVLSNAVGAERRTSIIEDEAKAILQDKDFDSRAAVFLVGTDRIDDAETYIIVRAAKLNGDYYPSLLELAKAMLKHDRQVATSAVYRALLDSILARAKAKIYHHGVSYLKKLDSLALKVHDWKGIEPHSSYLAKLRQKHKLKSSFWSQYDS